MAEQVQAALDQMVEPLQDLQERNVFTPAEIHAIVERRRDYEYMLRRRNVRKIDCLKYVDDEVKLEQLRELRTRKIQREAREDLQKLPRAEREKKAQQLIKKHIGDRHILQHIHVLWSRIFRKFRADQDLYLQYAEFLKQQGANGKLSQLYASVLAIFPREAAWWIRAASHEFFANNNVKAARVMLQRGIRVNPKSTDLWVQSFVLELHFVQKIHGRRYLLELPTTAEEDDLYKLARLVHDNAIQALEDDGATSLSMWQHCQYFPHTTELQEHILKALRKNCGDKPHAWIAMAQCSLKGTDQRFEQTHENDDDDNESDEENNALPPKKKQKLEKGKDPVLDILNEAIKSIPSSEMYVDAVRFLRSIPDSESRQQMIEKLFDKANSQDKFTVELLLEQVDFLEECDQRKVALKKLRKYTGKAKVTDARIWLRWASLVFPSPEAATILSKALKEISMASSDHYMTVLLQLLGVMMALKRNKDCWALWDQVLLLSPGCHNLVEEATLFCVKSVADACLQFLAYVSSLGSPSDARKVYEAVLFQSSILDGINGNNAHLFKAFIDKAVECEFGSTDEKSKKNKRISLILDTAVRKFEHIPHFADELRQKRDDAIYGGFTRSHDKPNFPCFDYNSVSIDDIRHAYKKLHVVVLRNVAPKSPSSFHWRDVGRLFQSLNAQDQESWCIEQTNSDNNHNPTDFLLPSVTTERAYCSFLVQKDTERYDSVLQQLPFRDFDGAQWFYEKALWIFFGRNPVGHATLPGRPDHTDSVSHDGTWHYQLSGCKEWYIRPSSQLLDLWKNDTEGSLPFDRDSQLHIVCQERDVILINTRLWFHRTELPSGVVPSVSYARDFRFHSPSHVDGGMTNVDGLYATENIDAGMIVFTEKDMPDCELHRSCVNPNCEVIQLEDGTGAIAALRDIQAGEFFCIAESDDDDDEEEEEEEDDDEEEEDSE